MPSTSLSGNLKAWAIFLLKFKTQVMKRKIFVASTFVLAILGAFTTNANGKKFLNTYYFNNGTCQSLVTSTNCNSTHTQCTITTASGTNYNLLTSSICTSTALAKKPI
jgi:hypothetical protein